MRVLIAIVSTERVYRNSARQELDRDSKDYTKTDSHFPIIMQTFGVLKENQTNHAQIRNTSEPTQSDVSKIYGSSECRLSKHVEKSVSLECLGISSYTSVFIFCNNK